MIKIRVKFSKTGSMRFIGHLDVMRYFQKAIRRSKIQVAYSEGFSPHPILSFAAPLGVGHTSDGEYLDMQLRELTVSPEEMKERLNQTMSEEIQALDIVRLEEDAKTSMALLAAADYQVALRDGYAFFESHEDFVLRWREFVEQPEILATKKTKKQELSMDLRPALYEYAFSQKEFAKAVGGEARIASAIPYSNPYQIYLQLSCGSVLNVKPELVMEAFCRFSGIAWEPVSFQIHRMEMYTDCNAKKGEIHTNQSRSERKLVALYQMGIAW